MGYSKGGWAIPTETLRRRVTPPHLENVYFCFQPATPADEAPARVDMATYWATRRDGLGTDTIPLPSHRAIPAYRSAVRGTLPVTQTDISELLAQWHDGDKQAEQRLMEILYPVIRAMAHQELHNAAFQLSLSATDRVMKLRVMECRTFALPGVSRNTPRLRRRFTENDDALTNGNARMPHRTADGRPCAIRPSGWRAGIHCSPRRTPGH